MIIFYLASNYFKYFFNIKHIIKFVTLQQFYNNFRIILYVGIVFAYIGV